MEKQQAEQQAGGQWVRGLLLTLLIIIAVGLSHGLRLADGRTVLLWLPTGVALAGILSWGVGSGLALVAGELLAMLIWPESRPWPALVLNWLMLLLIGQLLAGTHGWSKPWRLRDAGKLLLVGLLLPLPTAILSAEGAGLASNPALAGWLAAAISIWSFTPWSLTLFRCRRRSWLRKLGEMLAFIAVTALVAVYSFRQEALGHDALHFLLFPLAMLAALRLGQLGAVAPLTAVVVAALVWRQSGVLPDLEHLQYHAAQLALLSATCLLLAGFRQEGRQALNQLRAQQVRFNRVLDALPTYVWLKDLDGHYLFGNEAFAHLFGHAPHEIPGKTDEQLGLVLPASLRGRELSAADGHSAVVSEETLVVDGKTRTLYCQHFPLFDPQGRLYGVGATAADISQKKEEDRQLQEAMDKFRVLVELSMIGIYAVQDGGLVYINPQMAAILGYGPGELIGKRIADIVHPDDLPLVQENLRRRFSGEVDSLRYAFRCLRADGSVIHVEVHSRITQFNGRPAVYGTMLDITEQVQAAADLSLAAKVFESATEGIVITDTRSRIIAVNKAFTHLTGYRREDVVGKMVPIFEDAMSHDLFTDMMETMIVAGQWRGEFLARKADGSGLPVTLSVSMAKDDAGRLSHYVAIFSDISSRKQLENERQASESKFRALVELSLAGIYVVQDGIVVYANPRLAEMAGYTQAELTGMHVRDFTAEEDLPILIENHRKRLSGEIDNVRYTYRAKRRDGSLVEVEAHGRRFDYDGRPAIIGILLDISDRVAAEKQLQLSAKVFDNASEGILITDAEARIIAVNAAFTRITGYSENEAVGKFSRMFHGKHNDLVANEQMQAQLKQCGHWQGEMIDRRKGGETYPAWLSISSVRDGDQLTNYVGVFTDFSSRKEAEARLYFLANHDPLTQLPNRTALMDSLGHSIGQARQHSEQMAVLFVDLDRFKTINDTLGHHAGDKLLQVVAQRLRACLTEGDIIARLGGDEFTVLLETLPDEHYAGLVADSILQTLAKPVVIDHQEMYITCSIGISLYPNDGLDAHTLLKNADVAMYRAKEMGKNNCQFFASDMNAMAFERLLMENSLRHALDLRQFELYFQPQVDSQTGAVAGMEVLLRWRHPELGLIPPAKFVPLAEENGLIVSIGEWIIEETCRQGRSWLDAGLHFEHIAINLSPRQFAESRLPLVVGKALRESGFPSGKLELEVTESMIMKDPQAAVEMLNELKFMGVMLSIDDFGTGYSSLSNLKRFPIHNLKIDRSFIEGVPDDSDDCAITEAIIALAKKLDLKLIAEGVETPAQLRFLRERGCDLVQGFMFSRPLPTADMEACLRSNDYVAVHASSLALT